MHTWLSTHLHHCGTAIAATLGADVDRATYGNNTSPAYIAAQHGKGSTIAILARAGASDNAQQPPP